MKNKSYAMTVSVLRVGLLAAQIASSPSAAAQSTSAAADRQPVFMQREKKIALASSAYRPFDASKAPIYASRAPGGKHKPIKCQDCRGALSTGTSCGPQGVPRSPYQNVSLMTD